MIDFKNGATPPPPSLDIVGKTVSNQKDAEEYMGTLKDWGARTSPHAHVRTTLLQRVRT